MTLITERDLIEKTHFDVILLINGVGKSRFIDFVRAIKNKKDWSENLCGGYYCIDEKGEFYELESDEGNTLRLTYEQFVNYVIIAAKQYMSVCEDEDEKLVIKEILQNFVGS